MPREQIIERLATKYQEHLAWQGVRQDGIIELFLTEHDGTQTWTLILTTPDGRSCMIDAGEGWRDVERVIEELET